MNRILVRVGAGLAVGTSIYAVTDSQSPLYSHIVMPLMHTLDPETSHKVSIYLASHSLSPWSRLKDDDRMKVTLWGKELSNPVGLAAGYDKNAEAVDALFGFGFGLVEIGSVTPQSQVC
jgi:dihydroorotate dehydrogenase